MAVANSTHRAPVRGSSTRELSRLKRWSETRLCAADRIAVLPICYRRRLGRLQGVKTSQATTKGNTMTTAAMTKPSHKPRERDKPRERKGHPSSRRPGDAKRTQEQIMADLLANTGRAAQLRRKLAANQSRNWLLALVLHSFGRFAEHAQLSDLEAGIIKAFKQNGYDDTDLTKQGKMALELPKAVRAELFPPDFAALSSGSAFTLDKLRAAAPGIVKTMLAQPNVAVVDVEGIHAGRTTIRDVRMPSEEVLRKYASAVTVAIEPNAPAPAARAAAAAVASTFKIKATKFRCNHRATNSVFDPKNEFYVIFGSLGDVASRSPRKAKSSRTSTPAIPGTSPPSMATSGGPTEWLNRCRPEKSA